MSTFIFDGKILIKVSGRFLIFNSQGVFIDEVEFDHGTAFSADFNRLSNVEQKFIKPIRDLKNNVPKYLV